MDTLKILIADDHHEFRAEIAEFLSKQPGLEIIAQAADGIDALYWAHSTSPDLILMDISMPAMSGLEAARRIKEELPHIKIVFVTIHEEMTYQTLADVLGVDGFINKNNLKRDLPVIIEKFRKQS